MLFGGSYDYNALGIDDIKPAYPGPAGPFVPNTMDLRNYLYNRTRYGFGGEADYKIGDMPSAYLRGLYSNFKDFGGAGAYTPGINNFVSGPAGPNNTCGITTTGAALAPTPPRYFEHSAPRWVLLFLVDPWRESWGI
jgi:hypothetical protein